MTTDYILESELNEADLQAMKADEQSVIFWREDADGRRWLKCQSGMPSIIGKPAEAPKYVSSKKLTEAQIRRGLESGDLVFFRRAHDGTMMFELQPAFEHASFYASVDGEDITATSDEDREQLNQEIADYTADALQRLSEGIEAIRAESWGKGWTPESDNEDGFDDN